MNSSGLGSGPIVLVLTEPLSYYKLFYMLLLQASAIVHILFMHIHISMHLQCSILLAMVQSENLTTGSLWSVSKIKLG
jgi:hypothetical protein